MWFLLSHLLKVFWTSELGLPLKVSFDSPATSLFVTTPKSLWYVMIWCYINKSVFIQKRTSYKLSLPSQNIIFLFDVTDNFMSSGIHL